MLTIYWTEYTSQTASTSNCNTIFTKYLLFFVNNFHFSFQFIFLHITNTKLVQIFTKSYLTTSESWVDAQRSGRKRSQFHKTYFMLTKMDTFFLNTYLISLPILQYFDCLIHPISNTTQPFPNSIENFSHDR